ncbi:MULTISPECIES: flavodoxin family protein [unclassified Microbacterium]|uniref:flavodoxin family protein n=1 Tax=unclassified Microbacterium TaxID=2609290 RepID=UPI00301B4AEA
MTRALVLNCTLKPSPAPSSSELLAQQLLDALATHGVDGEIVRVVDHDVRPGVELDMGEGDAWPRLHDRVLAADILIVATPTWMGNMSSIAQRVLERLDADISETDDEGRPVLAGKVGIAVVVGNEDGAHAITAALYQGLSDVGLTIPSQGGVYWNGEAMNTVDYNDLDETPEKVAETTRTLARNAAHLADLLARHPYPAPPAD